MNVFPLLPLCRQPLPARQQIFAGLRHIVRHAKQLDLSVPRIRIRSLDVIPLSLSLPRSASLHDITNALDPAAQVSLWTSLSPTNRIASSLLPHLLAFYDSSNRKPPPPLPPMVTWNPSSLATIHTTPSSKLSHILKLAHRHVCHIQETQWSSLQYNHLLLQVPNCHIFHTSAVEGFSSGVATFLPKQFWSDRHSVVVPGFILSVTVKIQQLQVEYLNVYLHPSKVRSLGQSLLTHLQTPASRSHSLRIPGGDFNHIQKSSTSLFQNILQELDCPPPSFSPTFRKHDGYTSCLDLFLVQSCSSLSPPSASSFTFWPSYQPVGHGIHICKFNRPAPINPCPDDLPAAAIPSSAFYLPPSARVASPSLVPHDLLPLTRALLRLQSTTLLELKANFWAWWHQQKPSPLSPQTGAHHLHILKKAISDPKSHLLTIPRASWEWLLHHFPVTSQTTTLVQDHHVMAPLMALSQLLTQYDAQHSSHTHTQPRTQFSTPPTHTWHRCHNGTTTRPLFQRTYWEDLAEGASFWHAFLTPFWGPETIVMFKRNYVEAMFRLSQIQDKPSKSFDQNQPDITFVKK